MSDPPIRLCCMQRHYGATCLDGTFMCRICFDKFPAAQSWHGYDICLGCGEKEVAQRSYVDDEDADREENR